MRKCRGENVGDILRFANIRENLIDYRFSNQNEVFILKFVDYLQSLSHYRRESSENQRNEEYNEFIYLEEC